MLCRGGMGELARLPDEGGVNDQSCWLMDAFGIIGKAWASIPREKS